MSLLNVSQPSGTVGGNILPEDEELTRPRTGAELRAESRATAQYQTSRARSNLAENAVENVLETMDPSARAYIEERVAAYEKEKNTPKEVGWDPNEGILSNVWNLIKGDPRGANKEGEIRALDTRYDQVYDEILAEEGSPITPEAFKQAMAEELRRVTQEEIEGSENHLSNWPTSQALFGGLQAGLADPAEQTSMISSMVTSPMSAGIGVARGITWGAVEIAAAGGVTASYQGDIMDLYEEMGLEEHYGEFEAFMNVGAGMLFDTLITGGMPMTIAGGKKFLGKLTDIQQSAIKAGMTPDEVNNATSPVINKAKDDAEEGVVVNMPEDTPVPEQKIAANRVRQVAEDAAMGRTVDPDIKGKAQASKGPAAPTTEVAESSGGSVNPGVAIESAKAQDGKPFSAARVGREFIAEQKEEWMNELAQDIKARAFTPKQESSLAHAVKNKSGLEANIKEQKEVVAYHKSEAKKYAGTDEQAETRKMVKDATGTLTSMRQSLKIMNDNIKQRADLDRLIDELAHLKQTGTLIKKSRYAKQVTAAKKAAKETHEARATMGKTTAEIDGVSAARVESMMDAGVVPDTRPSRVAGEGGTDMDLDDAFKHSDQYYEEIDSIRRQQDSDMPDEDFMYDYDVDEDYNTITRSGADLADDAEAMDVAAEFIRGCM